MAKSVISLMFSQIIIKIFGLAYSMYLINKDGFGDSGNAIYMGGYQIYVLLLTISSIGVPNAVAKLVAEKIAINDRKGANKILKVSILSFGFIGLLGTLILFFGAKHIAENFLLIPECEYSIMVLSPAVFLVSISSVLKGYFNGIGEVYRTAKSQTIEQICKSVFTIIFVEIISRYSKNLVVMASVANFASSVAIFISFIHILKMYFGSKNLAKYKEINQYYKNEKSLIILKRILQVSVPITLSAILGSLGKNIDSFTIVRILTPILGEATAKLKYGALSSKIDMLTAMPLSFNIAFATTLVPAISSAKAKNDTASINKKIYFSILLTSIIAIPSAMGLILYAKPILNLLFPNASNGAELLKISAISIIFLSLIQTTNGALNGIGKLNISVGALVVGIIVKFFLNIILIPQEFLYEKGAIIGNVCSNMVTFFIVWRALKSNVKLSFSLKNVMFKPFFASVVMGFSSYIIYLFFIHHGFESRLLIIIVIFLSVLIYVLSLIFLKVFSKNELFLLPNGEKMYKILKKFKIYE